MSDDNDTELETLEFAEIEEGNMPMSAIPYEITPGANARVPHDKAQYLDPGDKWNDRVNMVSALLMTGIHILELNLKRPDRMKEVMLVKDNILYTLFGVWNSTSLPDNAFDAKDSKDDSARADRSDFKLVLKIYLPVLELLDEIKNATSGVWETLGRRALPTKELVEWLHDNIDEIEKPDKDRTEPPTVFAPFKAGGKAYMDDRHGYLGHDENGNWFMNETLNPRPRPEGEKKPETEAEE